MSECEFPGKERENNNNNNINNNFNYSFTSNRSSIERIVCDSYSVQIEL